MVKNIVGAENISTALIVCWKKVKYSKGKKDRTSTHTNFQKCPSCLIEKLIKAP